MERSNSELRDRCAGLIAEPDAIARPMRRASWAGRTAGTDSRLPMPSWMLTPDERRRKRIYRLVRGTTLFDPEWYVSRYGPTSAAHVDPLRHFVEHGAVRGFFPSPLWLGLGVEACAALGERHGKPGRSLWRFMRSQRNPGADAFLTRALDPLGPFSPQGFARALADERSLEIDLLAIDHAMGGGANRYRDRRLADAVEHGQTAALLTYHIADQRYCLELGLGGACVFAHATDLAEVSTLLSCLAPRTVVLNNLASYPDISDMIGLVRRLYGGASCALELPLHDFLPICPSFNLLDDRREFCGIPDLERCRDCIARVELPLPTRGAMRDIAAWRDDWAGILQLARPVAFSRSSRDLVARAYPALDPQLVELRPHNVDYLPRQSIALDFDAPLHIGVVGEISFAKGAQIVAELAAALQRGSSATRLSVIGKVEQRYAASIVQTGRYQAGELPRLLTEAGVNVCLVPSIWPETFCYVAEELMRLGLPVAAFDLGAPAERLRAYRFGHVLRSRQADVILDELATFWQALRHRASVVMPVAQSNAAEA